MTDHVEAEALEQEATEAVSEQALPKKPKKKMGITLGVIAAVIIVAGAGFFVWHEQPSFCNAICHIPMDPYYETYDQEPNTEGVDKWGNTVTNTSAMLCVSHEYGYSQASCLSCHVPTLGEQVSEGIAWVTGDYEVVETSFDNMWAATERTSADLVEARGLDQDAFCLNEACHKITREQLEQRTSNMEFNPHVSQHGTEQCTTCHKGHRASVMYCAQCHKDAEVPEGWITPSEEQKLLAL